MELTKTVRMTDKEFVNFVATQGKFGRLNSEFADHPMMPSFSPDKAISMVFISNKLENTLPTGLKHNNAYAMLKDILLDSDVQVTDWNSDGNTGDGFIQLVQHLKAFQNIMSLKKLTVKDLLGTHGILMLGAVSDAGTPILSGKIRTFGVNNGVEDYLYTS